MKTRTQWSTRMITMILIAGMRDAKARMMISAAFGFV